MLVGCGMGEGGRLTLIIGHDDQDVVSPVLGGMSRQHVRSRSTSVDETHIEGVGILVVLQAQAEP